MTTTKSAGAEKRRHPRFPLAITMNIPLGGETGETRRATICDLSMSGMSLTSDAVLEEGMLLHLKLNLPLEIRGEVRHAKSGPGGLHRYGIHFHNIKEGMTERKA